MFEAFRTAVGDFSDVAFETVRVLWRKVLMDHIVRG